MLRRLFLILRHWTLSLRHAVTALRHGLAEWFHILTSPVRAFRPRAWLRGLGSGVMELLVLARLARPRGLGSELVTGGWEVMGLVRGTVAAVVATVVGLFWIIVWLPLWLARACYHWPVWTWHFLRTRTRRQLVYVLTASVFIVGTATAVPTYLFLEHRRTNRINILQQQYEYYMVGSDVGKLEEVLAKLVAEKPDDAGLARRLEMVRAHEAPVSEPKLVRFFMRHHMAGGRVDESVREANKLLESLPNDWEARCYLARAALARGDRAGAKKQLATLPRAEDADSLPPYVAHDAFFLFRELGDKEREDDVVDFITLRVLPDLRSKGMRQLPTMYKLFLIRCYYVALTQIEKRPRLTSYWESVQLACKSIMEDPTTDVPTLVTVGDAQDNNLRCLNEFRQRQLVSDVEFNAMGRDLLGLQKALWDDVIRREPKTARAYIGLAEYHFILRQPQQAEQAAARGLEACGKDQNLVAYTGDLLRRIDPPRALAFLETTLREEDLTPKMLYVFEQVAYQASRRDKALAACRKALEKDPKQDWARRREAAICLELGRPTEAAAALRPIKDELAKSPEDCANYVRALCECGAYPLAEEFLEKVSAANCPVDVLLKAAGGLQASGRHAEAVRWARRALDVDKLNVKALRIEADSTRILADKGEAGWDVDLARDALRSYRAVLRIEPDDLKTVNNIAWLELKALHLPREAYESAAPLRAAQDRVGLPAEFHETLGAVYIGVGQYDAAVKVLRQAVDTAGPRVSFYAHLALAFHGLKQPNQAEHYLSEAFKLPHTPRELAELREAARTINGQ
ncbi:MAG TPA: tetratricopeptide repeat protein [Gemmataceae bacterium]|jgi:tetratricopeptide (TPR) repeat protein